VSRNCHQVHHLFSSLPRIGFPFNKNAIPDNGIYVLFEQGERAHEVDRIVRIGTHTGNNQLRSRLKQHFQLENKDRSIFRKNIGRALLNQVKDPFIAQWEIDLTTAESKRKYAPFIDQSKLREVESRITAYIQQNFRFITFKVDKKEDRLLWESKIISTVSLCNECGPSKAWFGLNSPKEKINQSGLWLVNELYKEPLSPADYDALKACVASGYKPVA